MSGASPRTARVRVPASSANLGSGFDCVGLAVDRWLTASAVAGDELAAEDAPITIVRHGTLASLDVPPEEDAVVRGFAAACAARGQPLPARLALVLDSEIPVARGLGSSSAGFVAGARLADAALALGLSREEVAELCTELEGHPDNVAPAVFGGAVLGVPYRRGGARRWAFAPIAVHERLAFAFVVPSIAVRTADARAVLPAQLPHATAVQAAGRSAALVHALRTGDATLLRIALDDLLHVPYRRHLVPGYDAVVRAACAAGAHGATLSGSGSTLLAVAPHDAVERVAMAMRDAFAAHGVEGESFVQRRAADAA